MKRDSRVIELEKERRACQLQLLLDACGRSFWAHLAREHRSVEGEVVVLRVERLVGVLELEVRRKGVLPSEGKEQQFGISSETSAQARKKEDQ